MDTPSSLQIKFIHKGSASGILFKPQTQNSPRDLGDFNTQKELFEIILEKVRAKLTINNSDISSSLLMMTHDPSWLMMMTRGINAGRNLQSSIEEGISHLRLNSQKIKDPVFLEKFKEFEIIGQKILDILNANKVIYPTQPFILMIEKPSPLDLLDPPQELLKGLVTQDMSPTSHTSILAKQMGIPVALIEDSWDLLKPGAWINLDFDKISFSPSAPLQKHATDDEISKPKTKDGTSISLFFNAAFEKDLEYLKLPFVKGIGLFRTEVAFFNKSNFPSTQDQQAFYSKIFKSADNSPIAFRIMDIGGDKIPSYFPNTSEDNPLLGWRSIRISLDRPLLLRHQIRALLRASALKSLYILFPLLTESAEFYPLCELLESEVLRERKMGHDLPTKIKKGVMIEVPSFAWQFGSIAKDIDFASVGTNDLFQFFFGVDRMNPHLAKRYDVLSPIFLSFLKHICDVARENHKTISVCGEMASDPIEALALLGLGYKTLSCSPGDLKSIANMIHTLDLKSFRAYFIPLLSSKEHTLREHIKAYAQDHQIDIKS